MANPSQGGDPGYVPKFSFGNFAGPGEAKHVKYLAKPGQSYRVLKEQDSQLPDQ
jgi:hypothetical protein